MNDPARTRRATARKPARHDRLRERVPTSKDILAELAAFTGTCVCGNLRMAARVVTTLYDDALRPCGIEANQMQILWALQSAGTVSAGELSRIVAMDQSTTSRNVALLVRKGLVRATPGKVDRRARDIALTPAGRTTLIRAYPRWKRAQESLRDATSELGDVVATGRLARRMVRRLQLQSTVPSHGLGTLK
jgi:DNA-binding MarR family transcriptional regulator